MDDSTLNANESSGALCDVTIRAATHRDIAAIGRLLMQLVPEIPRESVTQICSVLLELPTAEVIVGERENEIIGIITLSFRPAIHHGGLLGVIDELVVDERYRSRGIGNRLVDYAIEVFRQRGAVDIEVVSALHRTRSHEFYERKGFIRWSYVFRYSLQSRGC